MKFTTKQLSYEDILQYVSEEDIALFYLGVNSNSRFYSFFREETTPGKYLYYKGGRLYYNDFLESRSFPYLIMELNNWSYKQFLDHLQQDLLNQVVSTTKKRKLLKKPITNKTATEIKIKRRNWENRDVEYWQQFGISVDTLNKFDVCPISYFWINDKLFVADKLSYSYNFYVENSVFRRKIYQPQSTDFKWIANGGKICQGESMLPYEGDLLIITKSLKDVMCLNFLGITAIAPPSESSFLPLEYYNKQKERFKKIILFFDNDLAGLTKAKKFSEKYSLPYIYIPEGGEKDISDYRKLHGEEKTKELINKLLYEKETISY